MKDGRPENKREWNRQQREQGVAAKLAIPVTGADNAPVAATCKAALKSDEMKDHLAANGGNVTAAAKAVGISYGYAKKLMPQIREDLIAELNEVGATVKTAAKVVAGAMEANVLVRTGAKVTDSGVPDHAMRLKAFGHWQDVTGAKAPSRSIQAHQNLSADEEAEARNAPGRLARLREVEEMYGRITDVPSADQSRH